MNDAAPRAPRSLEAARVMLDLSVTDLWLLYVGLGGSLPRAQLVAFLSGAGEPELDDHDHDMLAHALNEGFTARGEGHPLPYAGDG